MTLKEHENKYIHIKRYGALRGLFLLPFNLLITIILFPFVFIKAYLEWYDGDTPEKYDCFFWYFYGYYNDKYELTKKGNN